MKCKLTLRLRSSSSRKMELGALTLLVGLVMGELPLNLPKMGVKNKKKSRLNN